jgi:signal transduction histidine kinase/ligand-binding sensor domain-containing protein
MKGILTLVLVFAATLNGISQKLPDRLVFEQVLVSGTIQSSMTEDILQDPHGMIWIGKNVLHRFNGKEFAKYSTIFPDSSGFGRREITRLLWDKVGNRLLVGTRNWGVLQYSYAKDRLEKIPSRDGIPIINDMVQTEDGKIWVSSFTSGFFGIQNDSLIKLRGESDAINPSGMLAVGNNVWVGCRNEVLIFSNNKIRRRISLSAFTEYLPNAIRAHSLMVDREGHLWVGTERDGLIVLDTTNNRVLKRFSPKQKPFYSSITRIAQDEQGFVWILTKGDGVILYSPGEDSFIQHTHQVSEKSALSGDHCTSICIDKSGIVWIGAAGALNKYDRGKIKFQHINRVHNDPLSLSDDNIRSVYEDQQGIIYLATSDGFLNIVDREENITTKVKVSLANSSSFITPLSICALNENQLLIGTSAGLLKFDVLRKKFERFAPLQQHTENLGVRQVISHGDDFYVSVRSHVVRFNKRTGEIALFTRKDGISNASHLAVDTANRLWVGVNKGVLYSDPQQKKFTLINLEKQKFRADSTDLLILSIQQVKTKLWVSTFNQGIFVIDLATETPVLTEHLTTATGLPDNTIYATLPDRQGQIWIAHNSGLSKYQPVENKYTHFTVGEGLQDEEFNRLAYFQNNRGHIILGGINGINLFDPAQINSSNINPQIKLLGMRVLSLQTSEHPFYSLLDQRNQIRLDYGQNSLRFEFFVPDYREPVRYSIQYKLEPLDHMWVETENLYSSTYANLSAGQYTFLAKVIGPDQKEVVARSSFTILPPFWQTWWFIAACLLVLVGTIYGITYLRIQSAEKDRIRLTTLLKIRTREIERSREELANLNKKKDFIFSILSHDLRSPLTTLKGFLGLLIDDTDSLSKEEVRKHAFTIRNSVTNSLDLIDNTLFWSLSQTGTIQYNPSTVPLAPLFEKIKGLYQLTADKKHIQLHFGYVDGLAIQADENMAYVLLRNLISNALKFTTEGKAITIDAIEQGVLVAIRIKDQGIGMTAEEVEKIFELDNLAVKKGTSSEKGTGLGLLLCKKFVELHQGKLLIESEEGVGSQFTVLLAKA